MTTPGVWSRGRRWFLVAPPLLRRYSLRQVLLPGARPPMKTICWIADVGLIVVSLMGVSWTVAALPSQPPDGRLAFGIGGLVCPAFFAAVGAWLFLAGVRRERPRPAEDEDEEPHDPFARPS